MKNLADSSRVAVGRILVAGAYQRVLPYLEGTAPKRKEFELCIYLVLSNFCDVNVGYNIVISLK
jgi:hypothetical protein